MTIGMMVAGIGCLLAGLLAIGFGIPINEFGLGNTLILAGSVAACSGLIILSLWVAVRELKGAVGQFGASPALDPKRGVLQPVALPRPAGAESDGQASDAGPITGERADAWRPPSAPPSIPWLDESTSRSRSRQERQSPQAPEAPPGQRRNLMFSSTSRRDRERGQGRAGAPAVAEPRPADAAPIADASEFAPASSEGAWPNAERTWSAEAPQRRRAGGPSKPSETAATRQPPAVESDFLVTVIRSGVVDGMAYSLYSDGSIEAEMPEGMMRFASVDELRSHLDQRP